MILLYFLLWGHFAVRYILLNTKPSEKTPPIQISFLCVCTWETTGNLRYFKLLFVTSSSYAQLTSKAVKLTSFAETDAEVIYLCTDAHSTHHQWAGHMKKTKRDAGAPARTFAALPQLLSRRSPRTAGPSGPAPQGTSRRFPNRARRRREGRKGRRGAEPPGRKGNRGSAATAPPRLQSLQCSEEFIQPPLPCVVFC